jgi:ribosomal protein S18 acetylase RimI-like enzyme
MYALRPATNDDFDFLYKLHEATLRVHVEAIWGWNEAVQHKMLHESLGRDPRDIVIVDGSDCGVVGIAPRPGELFMHMIALHPRVQRRGIGASLVRDFIARAEAARLPAALRVFKINVGARRLYQRLGFVIVGETETHYDMRCG